MTFQRYEAVHEVGHMVVGFKLHVDEQGIVFRTGRADEAAQAWFRHASLEQLLVRSFAGVLAHLAVLPETLDPRLREAYSHSVIFTSDHPHFDRLTAEERDFVSGARTDLQLARDAATSMNPQDPDAAATALRDAEHQARSIVAAHTNNILRITDDIYVWAAEPDREDDFLLLYPPSRAKALIRTA